MLVRALEGATRRDYGAARMIAQIFTVIAPVIFISLLGYIWERRRMPFDTAAMSYISSYIGGPCLMMSTLLKSEIDLGTAARIVAAPILLITVMGLIGWGMSRALKLPAKIYAPVLMFPNSGNMGVALCLFAFGQDGLAYAVTYFATMAGLQFSVGVSIASGKLSVKGLFTNPVLISIALSGVLMALHVHPPQWTMNVMGLLGGLMIPLMLLSLGTALAKLRVASVGRNLGFSLMRLGGGFVVGFAIATLLGLEGAARGSVIIQSAMPIAVFTYMFAEQFGNEPEEVAAMVFISTIISFISLPFLIGFALNL
jgi:predicted permease